MMVQTVTTAQGEFTIKYNPDIFHPTPRVHKCGDVIIWELHRPAGLLVQYNDGTKRLVKNTFHEGREN